MKLTKTQMMLVGFMLFSLFFGAGNLIFPPFLGNEAGNKIPIAFLGFIIPAVVLPVLGVIIVAEFRGLDKLSNKVHPWFSIVFTIVILLSIGPGLGIPRAASVPFEMAIKPYMSESLPSWLFMGIYSFIFFAVALWLAFTPSKLLNRIGRVLTPSLLILIIVMFITFLFKEEIDVALPKDAYLENTFLKGFCDGYQTMDTIAALNFGLVISNTLLSMGIEDNKVIVKYTLKTGIVAGLILIVIYAMLAFIGFSTSSKYVEAENGAFILREISYTLFGNFGAIFIPALFTLACLTTCVGLITSISKYFSDLFKKVSYKTCAVIITIVSFLICNLGLDTILSVSVPVLNAIYPISIVLIMLGLFDKFYKDNKLIYPVTIALTGILSVIYSIDGLVNPSEYFGFLNNWLLGYDLGFGWFWFAIDSVIVTIIIDVIIKKRKQKIIN